MFGFPLVANSHIAGGFSNLDRDAELFLKAALITDARCTYAVNTFVMNLKRFNLWNKINCLYGFVGATHAAHRLNMKNPLANTLSHSAAAYTNGIEGITGTGATTFTNFLASQLSADSYSIGFYNRTQPTAGASQVFMGAATGIGGLPRIDLNYTSIAMTGVGTNQSVSKTISLRDTIGFHVLSRTSLTELSLYRNAELSAVNRTAATGSPPSSNISLFSLGGLLVTRSTCGLAFIGSGLSQTDVYNLNWAVQIFENSLQRQV
jgi:hypothetical protein